MTAPPGSVLIVAGKRCLALAGIALLGCAAASTPPGEPRHAKANPTASATPIAPLEYYEPPPAAPAEEPPKPPASKYPPVRGAGAVSRGRGAIVHAETQAGCAACNGSWGYHGIGGFEGCVCGTGDGGKRCTSPLDCEAECIVLDRERFVDVRCGPKGCNGPEPVGQCSASVTDFGCHGRIVEMPYQGGVVREVQAICVD